MKDLVERLRNAIISGNKKEEENIKRTLHVMCEVTKINFSDLGEIICGGDPSSINNAEVVESAK